MTTTVRVERDEKCVRGQIKLCFMEKNIDKIREQDTMCVRVGQECDFMWLCGNRHGVERCPGGCVIHHLDWDKTNNTIENLICVTVAEHERIHNKIGGDEGRAYGYELLKSRTVDGLPPDVI